MSSLTSPSTAPRSKRPQRTRRRGPGRERKVAARKPARHVRSPRSTKAAIVPSGSQTEPAAADEAADSARLFDANEKTITVKEAAFRLNKTADAIRRWLHTGRLQGWQPGGRCCSVMVLESSVEQKRLCALGSLVRGQSSSLRPTESTGCPPAS